MWSIGSWGGSGLAALFGGAMIRFTPMGWKAIFIASIVVSAIAFLMIVGTPESKVQQHGHKKFDFVGLFLFIIGTLSLMIVLLYGSKIGWGSPITLGLAALATRSSTSSSAARKRRSSTSACSRTPPSPARRSRTSCSTAPSAC